MFYLLSFSTALALSFLLTIGIRRLAFKFNITDKPDLPRKIHKQPVPLLGGLAIFLSFWLVIGYLSLFTSLLPGRYIEPSFLVGAMVGGLILMLGGALDDRYNLSPRWQILFPILAAWAVIGSGIGIGFVSNPLGGGLWHLDRWQWPLFTVAGQTAYFVLLADVFTFIWLLGTMYTTKLLDGLDGLVSGITTIAAVVIFALSLTHKTYQPDVALLAIVLAGATLGFLIWNFHPAKIFLGEGGSVWVGFMLGLLAIISGGKVATALLVMGIPILDVGWVIIRRVLWERKSLSEGDRQHLHFRLLTAGFSEQKSVLLLWGLSALFGMTSLFLQTRGKVYSLLIMLFVTIILALWVTRRSKSFTV